MLSFSINKFPLNLILLLPLRQPNRGGAQFLNSIGEFGTDFSPPGTHGR